MIRYALVCDGGHGFDAWFRDSEAFDTLSTEKQVECPACRSTHVRKTLMAPAIRRASKPRIAPPHEIPAPPAEAPGATEPGRPVERPEPVMVVDEEKFHKIRAALRELHNRLRESAENVGPTFPVEARKIHEGDAPVRPIYGTATNDEVRSLLEDGIDLLPLPASPDDRN